MNNGIDQADTLRYNNTMQRNKDVKKAVNCIAVASGKGGVGKTFFSVNLASALQQLGKKVLLLDADLGLANADILLGTKPSVSLQNNIFDGVPLQDIVLQSTYQIDLLAASSGTSKMLDLGQSRMQMLVDELLEVAGNYDVLIIDCAAGINESVMAFIQAAPKCALVTTPEPTAIMDAYALMKVSDQRRINAEFGLIMNVAPTYSQGAKVANRLVDMAAQYLSVNIRQWGVITNSDVVSSAVRAKKPVLAYDRSSVVAKQLKNIAETIIQEENADIPFQELDTNSLLDGLFKKGSGRK